jgi:hypothetical protein
VIVQGRALHRGRPEDGAARQRQQGLQMLLSAPLVMLILVGYGSLYWDYGKPWSSSSSMTSNGTRRGAPGAGGRR